VGRRRATAGSVPAGCPLTARQFEMATLLTRGLTRDQIAAQLGVSCSTVRTILHQAYVRLGVANGAQAVAVFAARGWLDGVPPLPDRDQRTDRFARVYLDAFDSYLRTGSDRARRAMDIALLGARHDRNVPHTPPRRPAIDPIDRLLAAIARTSPPQEEHHA
jgi:DNA-binding CsgD family transcriptional regulator